MKNLWKELTSDVPTFFIAIILAIVIFTCTYFIFAPKEFKGYYLQYNRVMADWNNAPDKIAFRHNDVNIVLQVYMALTAKQEKVKGRKI